MVDSLPVDLMSSIFRIDTGNYDDFYYYQYYYDEDGIDRQVGCIFGNGDYQ